MNTETVTSYIPHLPTPLAVALCALPVVYAYTSSRQKKALPPGPKPLPLIGNVLDVPREAAWKVFKEWGHQYGDMIFLHTLGKPMLIVNSADIAFDLLDKRSGLYSFRPQFAMANEVIGWKFSLTSMDYSEKSKRQRKYMASYFAKARLPDYYPVQVREAHQMLNEILDDPNDYRNAIRRNAAGVTMMITYGHRVKSKDDEFIAIADKGVATIEAAGAVGAHIVDFVPWLRFIPDWFPGAGIKRLPPGTRENLQAFLHVPFDQVKKRMAAGTAIPCYTTKLLEQTKGQDDEGVLGTAALVYSGGMDTTMSAIFTAFTLIVANPLIQARIQAELDLVVGKDRLPDFSDRPRLPYLQCVISEALRWGASTPVGVPHRTSQDDVYRGYLIPKDTTILANQYAMLHDERVYPDPARFNPDRFLEGEGRTPQQDPRDIAFGFGRRICPGKDIAENTMWITIACMFYAFKITSELDKEGNPLPVDLEYEEFSVRHPKPFKAIIKPRHDTTVDLIRAGNEA
ncbi:cytochrome P450 [Irpex rosettiformis]|uniref:Cytochrome P450 n=1 Tax=Irpex rosettiformis TaxID=378272 RepID=A0ACB8U2E3_9APHY|nr:cytochrome P450 [Irpex rosettiformis]